MSDTKILMQNADANLLHTYNRFPVMLDHAEGVHIYDKDGKRYLDFAAGIAVCALGYSNEHWKTALKDQIDKITHCSNLFYNEPIIKAAEKVLKASGMDRVFFTNSGTEAIEGAIKAAKKYAYTRDGHAGHEIIAMEHSFHGRSIGALSVTGTKHYQEPFEPLLPGVRFATFNDLESVKAQITDKTCAIITETLQGEGGIYPADPAFLKGLRQLCDEKDILLILDEVQCGMGRTGAMFEFQNYDIVPDILTSAKALGNGVPVGAFLMTERVAQKSLAPGDHGTTYGGNPLVGAAVNAVFEVFESEHILENVQTMGAYLEEKLEEMVQEFSIATAHRGRGLIRGLVLTVPVGKVAARAIEKGLLVITAGKDVIRMVPPLVIGKEDIDEMTDILKSVLKEFEEENAPA